MQFFSLTVDYYFVHKTSANIILIFGPNSGYMNEKVRECKRKTKEVGAAHHKVAYPPPSPVVVKVPFFCGKITPDRGGAHK